MSSINDIKLIKVPHYIDNRGILTVLSEDILGFNYKRTYFIKSVPTGLIRGEHAHIYTSQFLICISGECEVEIDDGHDSKVYNLNMSDFGILIPPGIWGKIKYKEENTVLLVLASHEYDPKDYLHDYEEFKKLARGKNENNSIL